MAFDSNNQAQVSIYVSRLNDLCSAIKKDFQNQDGVVLMFANFENDADLFRQESSFFYLSGLQEPGIALLKELNGPSTLYVPNVSIDRAQWLDSFISLAPENAAQLGVDAISSLGDPSMGYRLHPFFKQNEYKSLIAVIEKLIVAGKKIFTCNPDNTYEYVQQRFVLERLATFIPNMAENIIDISPLITHMRRRKDMHEIECLYEAISVTTMAHEAAAQAIEPDIFEREVQGALEYIFTASGGRTAFPSIVAGGKNGTILHYSSNNAQLKKGDLVVVDIGAQVSGYCADLTRTYPVSGKFTKRQKELYNTVLATQKYIAEQACPGMWLINEKEEAKSLQHLAKKFLASKGLEKYFIHSIGHFLGLDVHDVGDRTRPLQPGDVFTIEPGIYIPEEGIGIRIEDNFWMVQDGVVCLSEDLPKEVDALEQMMIVDKD